MAYLNGNPPWATNSELNFNLPEKENFKRLSGTDAITGASNFDICEYIILKLLEKSANKKVSIAIRGIRWDFRKSAYLIAEYEKMQEMSIDELNSYIDNICFDSNVTERSARKKKNDCSEY